MTDDEDRANEQNVAYLVAAKKREEAGKKRQQVIQGVSTLIGIAFGIWVWMALSHSGEQAHPVPAYDPTSDFEVLNCVKKKGFGNWHEGMGATLEKFCELSAGLYYRQKLQER